MKKVLPILLAAVLSVSAAALFPLAAQEYKAPQVEKSTEKVRLNGKVYYSHIVREKQTLYSICKAYGVSLEEIYESNPTLNLQQEGLKMDQVLLIPIPEEAPAPVQNTKVKRKLKQPEESTTEKTVKPEVKQEQPKPEVKKEQPKPEVKKEEPKPEVKKEQPKPAEPEQEELTLTGKEDYFYHRVKWYEDISYIADKYKVSPRSILNINGMTSDKLTSRQLLKIPKNPADWEKEDIAAAPETAAEASVEEKPEETREVPAEGTPETVAEDSGDAAGSEEDPFLFEDIFSLAKNRDVNASILIPVGKSGRTNSLMLDFYSGALLAARDLGRHGVDVTLNAYDYPANTLPSGEEGFASQDFVIGPVSNEDLLETVRRSEGETWIVSPLDQKAAALADTLQNIIQAPSGTDAQISDMVSWVREDLEEGDKVVLLLQKGEEGDYPQTVIRQMQESGMTYTTLEYTRQESKSIFYSISNLVNEYGTGRFVLASESEAFAIEAVRNLFLLSHRNARIALYSTSKIRTFNTIEVEQLHDVNLHASVSYFVDYRNGNVQDFVQGYRALFNAEPSQFAFQGYDLMKSLSILKARYGKKWFRTLDKVTVKGLQSDFSFVRLPEGGFANTAVRRVVYTTDKRIIAAD